jgi:hypothetical protein
LYIATYAESGGLVLKLFYARFPRDFAEKQRKPLIEIGRRNSAITGHFHSKA